MIMIDAVKWQFDISNMSTADDGSEVRHRFRPRSWINLFRLSANLII